MDKIAPIPPLPDIAEKVNAVQRSVTKAKSFETKVGTIDLAIDELQGIKSEGWVQYQELVKGRALDDPDPFWDYDTKLDRAIWELSIHRKRLMLEEQDRSIQPPTPEPAKAPRLEFTASSENTPGTPPTPDVMDTKALAEYLRCSESWIYKNYEAEGIPFSMTAGLRFLKSSVDDWLRSREQK
jgi:predicted DNA-binding transcriptional regulator AlpA